MHFMLQKEVVDRMAAGPGSKTYGRLSVMLQARCRVTPLFEIAPDAFKPAPKVNSSFVCLLPFQSPRFDIENEKMFGRVVAQAFATRRKTLRNCLKGIVDAPGLDSLGIDPSQRAENLQVGDFVRIANLACKSDSLT
jgi:16S rRNA (adenine1518-N6/adenine1519-N6)-dimethyltransferase